MLVKKLHPDLNPNQTFFELNLFYRAVYCFEHGDLKGLESVAAILPENAGEETTQIDDLKRLVQEYEDKVMELKKKYPFNKKELLEDDESGQKYKNMLNELIEDRKEAISKAIHDATEDDVIALLGKGDENYQMIDGKWLPYETDIEVVKEELNKVKE